MKLRFNNRKLRFNNMKLRFNKMKKKKKVRFHDNKGQ